MISKGRKIIVDVYFFPSPNTYQSFNRYIFIEDIYQDYKISITSYFDWNLNFLLYNTIFYIDLIYTNLNIIKRIIYYITCYSITEEDMNTFDCIMPKFWVILTVNTVPS